MVNTNSTDTCCIFQDFKELNQNTNNLYKIYLILKLKKRKYSKNMLRII